MHEAHHVWFICDGHHKRPHPQAVVHVIRVPHRTGVLPAVRCDNAVRVTGAGGMQVLQSGVRFASSDRVQINASVPCCALCLLFIIVPSGF